MSAEGFAKPALPLLIEASNALEAIQGERDYYSQFSDRGDWMVYRHEWLTLIDMLREAEDTLRINARGPELVGLRHRIVKALEPYPERGPLMQAAREHLTTISPERT